ncbi:hypothetical protein, partial [Providencia rustigianii]|uniref:hypothetical protein n=1 Tax=Providencia rustigianii TaxID=158850 RepID=UPI00223F94ED
TLYCEYNSTNAAYPIRGVSKYQHLTSSVVGQELSDNYSSVIIQPWAISINLFQPSRAIF